MAALWRRAWRRPRVSSTVRGGGGSLQLISSSTTTVSGTTPSTATYTTTTSSDQERSLPTLDDQELVKTRRHIMGLVEEFCAAASDKVTAPDRWLSELHVAWLSELDASAGRIFVSQQIQHLAQSWIQALRVIGTFIWGCFSGFYSQEEALVWPPAASESVRFLETTLFKMLTFVDTIAAPPHVDDPSGQQRSSEGAAEKLRALLDVRDALSLASEQIITSFHSSPYVQSTRITDDMEGLLLAELDKLDQAVLDTLDQIRTAVMSSLDDDSSSWGTGTTYTPIASPDIHKVTRSVVNYINVLFANGSLLDPIMSKALLHRRNYAPRHGDMCSLDTLIESMVHSLEEKFGRVSHSFPDRSIGFLFLINNFYFVQQQLHPNWLLHDRQINRYIQSYLQMSWEPVLKYLHNPVLHCFKRNSPLPKFESKFQTTYDAQKLWKVPDPELRKRLREAIIKKVTSGFKKYLEDNNRITPRVTPEEMEEMLQELFEG